VIGLGETLRRVSDSIVIFVLLIVFGNLLPPKGVGRFLLLFVCIYYPIIYLKKGSKAFNFQELLKTFKLLLVVITFYYIIKILGNYGWLGLIITIMGFAAYKIIRGRKLYMEGVRDIEKRVWGKSLDKNNWRKKNE
jgi:hypothetical protein